MPSSGSADVPRLSIITPSFNQAAYLEAALQAARAVDAGAIAAKVGGHFRPA